jgi:predicted nucleic acid-binding protein
VRKYALDTSCYIDASHDAATLASLHEFTQWAAPGLFLSAIVSAELRAGTRDARARKLLEVEILSPYERRGRVLTPSLRAWEALGTTLGALHDVAGLQLSKVSRSFAFDVLLAYSCREAGVILVTRNARDMERIRRVFSFEYVAPYPASSQARA